MYGSEVHLKISDFIDGYALSSILIFAINFQRDSIPDGNFETTVHKHFRNHVNGFDLEAGLFLGIIGCRVGFSPGQFADFLLGWFGLDIAGDDTKVPDPEPACP